MKTEIMGQLMNQKDVMSAGCLATVSAAINWFDLVNDLLGCVAVISSIILTWIFIRKHSLELRGKTRKDD